MPVFSFGVVGASLMAVAFSGQTPQPLVKNADFVMGIEPEHSDRQPFNSNTCPAVLEIGDMAQYPVPHS